ncbi:MAG TPA: hypothetical protein VJ840_14060 [Gemmatimonadaceae bacterium]|nr:hypothetical protein [Gemmatimonadaceae bacterium]
MDNQQPAPTTTSKPRWHYWLRTAGAAVIAALASVGVSAVGQSRLWPHPESIAFGVFLFLIPVLHPIADRRRVPSWPLRLAASVIAGVIGGIIYALLIER